jgi:hypothetical protein
MAGDIRCGVCSWTSGKHLIFLVPPRQRLHEPSKFLSILGSDNNSVWNCAHIMFARARCNAWSGVLEKRSSPLHYGYASSNV